MIRETDIDHCAVPVYAESGSLYGWRRRQEGHLWRLFSIEEKPGGPTGVSRVETWYCEICRTTDVRVMAD